MELNLENLLSIVSEDIRLPVISELNNLENYHKPSYEHCLRVSSRYKLLVTNKYEKSEEQVLLGCLLHDIGKLYVKRELLDSPKRLLNYERGIMRHHTKGNREILDRIFKDKKEEYLLTYYLACGHHELNGYPRKDENMVENEQRKMDDKGLLTRFSLIDAFDAMTDNTRNYQSALTKEEAIKRLKEQFPEQEEFLKKL